MLHKGSSCISKMGIILFCLTVVWLRLYRFRLRICRYNKLLLRQSDNDMVTKQHIPKCTLQLYICNIVVKYIICCFVIVCLGCGKVWGRWRRNTSQSTMRNMWSSCLSSGAPNSHWTEVCMHVVVFCGRNTFLMTAYSIWTIVCCR